LKKTRKVLKNTDKWTPQKVTSILTDPIYAFGIWIEPAHGAFTTQELIQVFNYCAPEWFWRLTSGKKARIYRSFFDWLEQNGLIKILMREVETIISVDEWIKVQEIMLLELKQARLSKKFVHIIGAIEVFFEVAATEYDE